MSLIIVEGPDGAGKSTLIDAMAEAWSGVDVTHHNAYLGESVIAHHYFEPMVRAIADPARVVVMDRSWIAEPIYARVMRPGAPLRLPHHTALALEATARAARAVTVLCLPPFERCEAAWRSRLEREYPRRSEQLRAIYDGYAAWWGDFGRTSKAAVRYDYTVDDQATMLRNVRGML